MIDGSEHSSRRYCAIASKSEMAAKTVLLAHNPQTCHCLPFLLVRFATSSVHCNSPFSARNRRSSSAESFQQLFSVDTEDMFAACSWVRSVCRHKQVHFSTGSVSQSYIDQLSRAQCARMNTLNKGGFALPIELQ